MKNSTKISPLEKALLILVVLSFTLMMFVMFFTNTKVISGSMENTIMTNARVIYKKFPKDIKRNDIIVFNYEEDKVPYAKRVIGIPGDEIILKDGNVYINGKPETIKTKGKTYSILNEYFSEEEIVYEVPKNSYFVMGDNREYSFDSREFEEIYINKSDIIGKALYKFSIFSDNNQLYFKKLR